MRSSFAQVQHQATTDTAIQDFWLQNLSKADALTRWVLDEISPWLGDRILEVGCGIGTYTAQIAVGSRRIVAVDMEYAFVQEANRRLGQRLNLQLICGDATEIDIPTLNDKSFDTVMLLDVLEHNADDIGLLRCLSSRLKPGGHLILKVPAMPSLYSPMDQALGHWRRYDKNRLSGVIHRSGLEIVDVWSFNAFAVLGWWWNGRVQKRRSPPAEQVALFNRLVPMLRLVDRAARLLCGISLIAVGRRPSS
jgi:2-polyprenyl-3-methyl-5-hydroxy-6-metoxy-1,4-benzoquinol methylase